MIKEMMDEGCCEGFEKVFRFTLHAVISNRF